MHIEMHHDRSDVIVKEQQNPFLSLTFNRLQNQNLIDLKITEYLHSNELIRKY